MSHPVSVLCDHIAHLDSRLTALADEERKAEASGDQDKIALARHRILHALHEYRILRPHLNHLKAAMEKKEKEK
jgi:hypothetical protein